MLWVMVLRRRLLMEAGGGSGEARGRGERGARGLVSGGGGVEVGDAVAGNVRAGVALLVAGEEVQADELLVATGHVTLVYLLGVVCGSQSVTCGPGYV